MVKYLFSILLLFLLEQYEIKHFLKGNKVNLLN